MFHLQKLVVDCVADTVFVHPNYLRFRPTYLTTSDLVGFYDLVLQECGWQICLICRL